MPSGAGQLLAFPTLSERLPPSPSPTLDPVLDAAADCFARHGLSRTSVSDIARELGVAPSTVYRKVGSVENAAWLLATREGHRFVGQIPEIARGVKGARRLTVVLASVIEAAWVNPVFAKVMRDEAEFVGRTITRRLPALIDHAVELLSPLVSAEVAAGRIRRQDPERLTRSIVRVAIAFALAPPPPGELARHLDELLLPVLTP